MRRLPIRSATRPDQCDGGTNDGGGLAIDHGEQHARRPVGNSAIPLPVLNCPYIQTETVGGGIIHDPAGQRRPAPHVGQHLAQRSLNLTPDLGTLFFRQRLLSRWVSATSRACLQGEGERGAGGCEACDAPRCVLYGLGFVSASGTSSLSAVGRWSVSVPRSIK